MTTRYKVDPGQGRFTVQAFVAGMLARLGHSPTFAVRESTGVVQLEGPGIQGLALELRVRADSLELVDRVSAADRAEMERRARREVLETAAFPEVVFRTAETAGDAIGPDRYRVFLGGQLTLHGVTQPFGTDAELSIEASHLRLHGGCVLRMSAYRIKPVTALAGAIKLKDELHVSFDLVAVPEAS